MNYVFFDLETSSRDHKFGQILEFAGILCNDNFQILDEPLVLKSRLIEGTIPEVGALLVTNTTPQMLKKRNLSHYDMIKQILKTSTKWSPAIWTGWNAIDFDFNFIRSTFYKTLNEIYFHQFHGNKRSDILVTARAANLFYPGCLKIPMNEEGKQNFKLDQIASLNGIKHDEKHTALSDTQAVYEMAKIICRKAKFQFIGLRPGEKLHEVMCPDSNSDQTVEFKNFYCIKPTAYTESQKRINYNILKSGEKGKKVNFGFNYNSKNNCDFLKGKKLNDFLKRNRLV